MNGVEMLAEPKTETRADAASARDRFRFGPLAKLLLLTAIGALLRFSFITRPPLWFDEAAVWTRVCGTYQQMLDALVGWGFGPLHYTLYWWIGQHFTLTPFVMRFVPALGGTLMIPAMYWLARELRCNQKTALLVAAFTCFSAYMLDYSRDAKMYSHFWLMCAVNVACMLWWLRVRNENGNIPWTIPWLCWIASGAAMMGLHLPGGMILAIEVPIILVARRGDARWLPLLPLAFLMWPIYLVLWALELFGETLPLDDRFVRFLQAARARQSAFLLFVLGLALILMGPAQYYFRFNKYADRVDQSWHLSGIQWVEQYNRGRSGPDLVTFTASAYLFGWEWPRIDQYKEVNPRTLRLAQGATVAIFGIAALGIFAWRRRSDGEEWRRFFWLAFWIVVPSYGVYCKSMDDFESPMNWIQRLFNDTDPQASWPHFQTSKSFLQGMTTAWSQMSSALTWDKLITQWHINDAAIGVTLLAGVFALGLLRWSRAQWTHIGRIAIAIVVLLLACQITYAAIPKPAPGSVWMPRYLGAIWPAFAIAMALLVLRLPARFLRWTVLALMLVANMAQYTGRVFLGNEPPADYAVRDVIDTHGSEDSRMYYAVSGTQNAPPGTSMLGGFVSRYYTSVMTGTKVTPIQVRMPFGSSLDRLYAPRSVWLPLASTVLGDLNAAPGISHIIVWDKPKRSELTSSDPLLEALGAQWKCNSDKVYFARDHWTWRDLFTIRRREYVRGAPPSTKPVQ